MSYLEEIHRCTDRIDNISDELSWRAQSFRTTGNEYMYDLLMKMSMDLETSSKDITKALSKKVTQDLSDSQATSKAIVNSAIAAVGGDEESFIK